MANELDQLNLAQQSTLPPELYAQQQALNRQQQMAALLMQQNQQPQGQMVSGRYVAPSFFQNLQPVANMLTGAYLAKQGDTKAAQLAQQLREGKQATEQKILNLMEGTPDKVTELAGPYAGKVPMPVAYQQGNAPDLRAALREIRTNEYGVGKDLTPTLLKQLHPEKPASILEYEYARQNPGLIPFMHEKAQAGATRNVFNISDVLGKDLGQVQKLLEASQGRVQQGELSTNAANKIEGALKSGNLNIGPGATVGQSLGQIGDALGLVNEKGQEKLVNTRAAVQGLAQMWAASRAQAKGQGAMDQQESQLYGKIASGNIDSLSMPELKYIVDQTKAQGNYFRKEHDRMLGELKKDEKLKRLVPFYDVGYMPTLTPNFGNTGNTGKSNGVSYLGPAD